VQKISFNELINNYSSVILRTAARILGDTQQAQDVHQEVFLEIWRRWHKYNGRTNWNAYLYRATVRLAIRFAKKARTRRHISQQTETLANTSNPDDNLRVVELQRKLALSMAKLPKRQADVFVLSRIEGLGNDKIAEILGCSQETVRVHLHRAVKQLARRLSDYLNE
jgi:RNA polymerase sigma-70 factor (ECF subfamily)